MMKRLLGIATLTFVVGGGAVFYFGLDAGAEAPRLMLATATRGDVVASISATGTLQPVDTVAVGTQVSGTIATLGADFNQTVRRGQVIATLDPAVLASQVAQAEASVVRLNADLERTHVELDDAVLKLTRAEQLAHAQLIAAQDVDTARSTKRVAEVNVKSAQAQLDQAQASLDQSRVNLSHTVIASPTDGIVLSRDVEVGQTVSAGLQAPTLFVIARSLDALSLEARVDESDVGQVKAKQPVVFTVDAYPDRTFTGTVRQVRLQPTVVQNVVSYTTVIDVPNPGRLLQPGMTATLAIETARADNVMRVPAGALRFRPDSKTLTAINGARAAATSIDGAAADGPTVWTSANGTLQPFAVTTGLTDGVLVALVEGDVPAGAQVVTGLAASTTAATTSQGGSSPLMPNLPRPGGQGRR